MSESYCGKDCSSCETLRTTMCPGCRKGPGKAGDGDCLIAACCRMEGLVECSKCQKQQKCEYFKLGENDQRKYSTMSKDIKLYFGVLIIDLIFTAMSELIGTFFVSLIATAISVFLVVLQFKMQKYSEKFKAAAMLTIINVIAAILVVFILSVNALAALVVYAIIIAVGTAAACNELAGFSDLILSINPKLSVKIDKLIKTMAGFGIVLSVTFLVSGCIPFSSYIIVVAAIGFLVCRIIGLVYISQTSSACEYASK